jgi:hypothetical protein
VTADPADGTDGGDNFPDDKLAEWCDAELEIRRGKALLMRLSGMTFATIAGALKVSVATARKDYDIALAAHATDSPEKMIARQRAVLTDILHANYRNMLGGDKDAAATILRALDREAKLFGLDAPTRILASINPVDYANEAARLIDTIKSYDDKALDTMFKPKEIDRDRTQEPLDVEAEPDTSDGGEIVASAAPTDDSGDRPAGEAGADDDPRTDPGFDPDDDDDWADVD